MRKRLHWLALGIGLTAIAPAQVVFNNMFGGNSRSVQLTQAPRDNTRMFLVEQRGWGTSSTAQIRVFNITSGALLGTVATFFGVTVWDEGGLLGLAFHPEFGLAGSPNSRTFFVYLTTFDGPQAVSQVRRLEMNPANPNVALNSGDVILQFNQPGNNHNGGTMNFGDDGFLYIGTGDGGGAEPGHQLRAQDLNLPLGKMLRIDVNGDDFPSDNLRDYRIPASNPFVGINGMDEVYHWGLRNPWKWDFDSPSVNGFGGLTIGDVGAGQREELNYLPPNHAGTNFGWPQWEGKRNATTGLNDPMPPGLTGPFLDYQHPLGVSVAGGVVYRGTDLGTDFYGAYFFVDSFSNWAAWPKLNFDLETGALLSTFPTWTSLTGVPSQEGTPFITSIDADNNRELWISTYQGFTSRVNRVGGPSRSVRGQLALNDLAGPFSPKGVNVEIRMNSNPTVPITLQVGLSPNGGYVIPVPTGAGTLTVNHGSWLKRVVPFNTTSGSQSGIHLVLQNGDVDNSGEVDAADIDNVIANFGLNSGDPGYAANRNADLDRTGELDAADIDVVIANFGAIDD